MNKFNKKIIKEYINNQINIHNNSISNIIIDYIEQLIISDKYNKLIKFINNINKTYNFNDNYNTISRTYKCIISYSILIGHILIKYDINNDIDHTIIIKGFILLNDKLNEFLKTKILLYKSNKYNDYNFKYPLSIYLEDQINNLIDPRMRIRSIYIEPYNDLMKSFEKYLKKRKIQYIKRSIQNQIEYINLFEN